MEGMPRAQSRRVLGTEPLRLSVWNLGGPPFLSTSVFSNQETPGFLRGGASLSRHN